MLIRLLLTFYLAVSLLLPCANAGSLDEVLSSMDRAASSFRDMSATLKRIDHTAVINDTSEESGKVRMKRTSRKVSMLIEFTKPDPRTVSFEGRKAQIYYPKIMTVQVYDLGKYRQLVDQFLLLGFGSSGKELRKNYSLRVVGEDKVSGELTTRLELVPKTRSARKHLDKVELWISTSGYPLQQKFYQPSEDYIQITYSDLVINPNLPEDALKLRLPDGVKRQYPQK
jgi:outer membrane lipoprotein-sorting protein